MLAQLRLWPIVRIGEEIASSFLRLVRLEYLSPPMRVALAYSFRTWVAGIMALYLAFLCQLESPYWAAIAVWIGSQPIAGMALSKSFYRIVGTIVGTCMGVVLIALFAQTPELFILALALWVGGCTLASNLLRNFRSYGTVLAGYTTAIVALPTVANPDRIFDVAMARGSCTILGIICVIIVTRLFTPHQARGQVLHKLKAVLGDTARRAAFPLARRPGEDVYALAYRLLADLINLDTEIDYAAAESASFRIHANRARDQLAELFGVISAARAIQAMEDEGGTLILPEALERLREEAVVLLLDVPMAVAKEEVPQVLQSLRDLRHQLAGQNPGQADEITSSVIRQRLFIDHLDDLLGHFENALLDSMALEGPWASEPRRHLDFHRDHRLAWINALRAFAAVIFAGAFWIETAWPSGASMMIFVAVVCSLFSALPRPDQAGMIFMTGTTAAVLVALPFTYLILVNVDGNFELMALALALVMIPGTILAGFPKTMLFGFAFSVNFFAAIQLTNPMNYNIVNFLNNNLALVAGVAFGSLAYKLVLPPDLLASHRYVRHRIKRAFEILALREPPPPPASWKSRMFDRVNRLYVSAEALGAERNAWMETGLRALDFGNGILRLRELLAAGKLNREMAAMVQSILDALGWFTVCPRASCLFLRSGIGQMQQSSAPAEPDARLAFIRTLGTLREMDLFFERHPQYLEPK